MANALYLAIAELLLRNGFVSVDVTSWAIAKLLQRSPEALLDNARLAKEVDRDMAVLTGSTKKDIAAIVQAQLPETSVSVLSGVDTSVRAAIFVATDLEFKSVARLLTGVKEALDVDGNWIARGRTPKGFTVSLVKTGQGNVASGAVGSVVLSRLRPVLAVFCGIAGGLHDQDPGTVVLASYVHDYESAEDGAVRGSRSKSLDVPHRVQQLSGALARAGVKDVPGISVGPIASGEKLVTDSQGETARWMKVVASDAAAVEMEGLGLMRAAANLGISATVVRAVSDHRDDKTTTNDKKNQPIAAQAAAAATIALIDLYLVETSVE